MRGPGLQRIRYLKLFLNAIEHSEQSTTWKVPGAVVLRMVIFFQVMYTQSLGTDEPGKAWELLGFNGSIS